MTDRHIRRNGNDYGTIYLKLLPQGQAWPKDPGTTLDLACRGLAEYWGVVDGRAADLLEIESDPRVARDYTMPDGSPDGLLDDWERNWGLPDPCEVYPPDTVPLRQDELLYKMTLLGRQDRQFFIDLAEKQGQEITIREYAPYMCGVSRVGDTRGMGDAPDWVKDYDAKILLHFDGADASTSIVDSSTSPKTFTVAGNAQIDTAQSKFGTTSLLCDGTGDWISAPDHADYALGSGDFTIECWFNCNAASGTIRQLAGQGDAAGSAASRSFIAQRLATNFMQAGVYVGATPFLITGTTQYTNAVNTGWHHLALVRSSNILKMFIDGTQQGGNLAMSGTVNNSSNALRIGAAGEVTANPWLGWIDEFRLSAGIARWTANFTPPTAPHSPIIFDPDDPYFRWQLGPRELRYYWLVNLENVLTGVECIFTRYKPGHSDVVFTYRSILDRSIGLYPWLMV